MAALDILLRFASQNDGKHPSKILTFSILVPFFFLIVIQAIVCGLFIYEWYTQACNMVNKKFNNTLLNQIVFVIGICWIVLSILTLSRYISRIFF